MMVANPLEMHFYSVSSLIGDLCFANCQLADIIFPVFHVIDHPLSFFCFCCLHCSIHSLSMTHCPSTYYVSAMHSQEPAGCDASTLNPMRREQQDEDDEGGKLSATYLDAGHLVRTATTTLVLHQLVFYYDSCLLLIIIIMFKLLLLLSSRAHGHAATNLNTFNFTSRLPLLPWKYKKHYKM